RGRSRSEAIETLSSKTELQMKSRLFALSMLLILAGSAALQLGLRAEDVPLDDARTAADADGIPAPTSVAEARARARLLHESIHGTLQVVHRDFFDEDQSHTIPSASLEDMFVEMAN